MKQKPQPKSKGSERDSVAPAEDVPDTRHGQGEALIPVIGFGASDGGLEAFGEVLDHIPPDAGMTLVLIRHLNPQHNSTSADTLSAHTSMAVVQPKHGSLVEPNHVYVIPPNTSMRISGGRLLLSERSAAGLHLPIDEFFRSLADEYGSRSIAVLLSGTASDGTMGMRMVKAIGGISIVQDRSAKYDAMPRTAMAAGCVDMVLPPAGIAKEILRLCGHPLLRQPETEEEPAPATQDYHRFGEIYSILRSATGVDFSLYKHGTLQRRILRRMALNKIEGDDQYVRFLKENSHEVTSLFQDILITVTGFFREPNTFDALKRHVFPVIFKDRLPDNPLRIWVPGCSTGEESYSLAMCVLEYERDTQLEIPVQIFATDLNGPALERARAGVYPESIAGEVSAERLRRFFVRVDGQHQISRTVRDMCIFAKQNLTKDPPFSRLDLILCRNLLIYLGSAVQKTVMRFFHYALKPNGYLALGLSETTGSATDLFAPIDRKLRIYARKSGPAGLQHYEFGSYADTRPGGMAGRTELPSSPTEVQRRVDQLILSRYSPAGALIDSQLNIIQFHGHTGPYLEHTPGDTELEISKMLRPELAASFRQLLDRARKKSAAVKGDTIRFTHLERAHNVRLSITPVTMPGISENHFLVLFEEFPELPGTKPAAQPKGKGTRRTAASRVRDLEEELASTKQYLESVIEEQQATTEELKSANEEVQSSNEELQSTNEELLTAKEELQSTNEELTMLNQEMQSRNSELSQINDDLNNLLGSVNIPIVMVGNDLRIRRFTLQAEKVLNLLPTDIGRRIVDLQSKIDIPGLDQLLWDSIESLRVKEAEVADREGRWFTMWIRPYRTMENRIDGAVMVLVDITERKLAAEARYRRLFESAREGIVLIDAETGGIIDLNPYMSKTFSIARSASIGLPYWDLDIFRGTGMDARSLEELRESETIQRSLSLTSKSGEYFDIELLGNVYREGDRRVMQFNIRDVTARKREETIRREREEPGETLTLEAMGRLAGGLANDFSDLMTAITGYANLVKRGLPPGHPGGADIDRICDAAGRAEQITRQLFALDRHQPAQAEILNLNDVIRGMEQVLVNSVASDISLALELDPEIKRVSAPTGQIQQVVLSLVLSARGAIGPPAWGRIAISTCNRTIDEAYSRAHPAVPPGDYVVLEISDTRSGMPGPAADQPGIFDPFFSVEHGRSSGHGLSIYDFIRQQNGYIWAANELGKGTTVRIFLPPVRSIERAEGAAEPAPAASETILVVDETEMVREVTGRILRDLGYRVMEARDGGAALGALGDHPIHLVLMNSAIPGMTSTELAERVQAVSPSSRILLMTPNPPGGGSADQVIEYIQKPFTPEVLSARIREILEGKSRHA